MAELMLSASEVKIVATLGPTDFWNELTTRVNEFQYEKN
jgi:hypothetical protein